ncbi:hypothetical protein NQZ68_037034 [Dissostichus eleginoides]|nr:hypothetical protein NQZ68_037034 [Dissostichus eleginoides]
MGFQNLEDVRLVSVQSRCAGALEVQHQEEWRAVSFLHSWSLREAAVVCTQLGCGAPVSSSRVQLPGAARPAWRFYSDCDGSEGALMGCGSVKKWLSSSGSTQVVCSARFVRNGRSESHSQPRGEVEVNPGLTPTDEGSVKHHSHFVA